MHQHAAMVVMMTNVMFMILSICTNMMMGMVMVMGIKSIVPAMMW